MPVVKPSISPVPVDTATSSVGGEASGIVGSMHGRIERHFNSVGDGIMPSSPTEKAVEALSRWAAYPALLIAAVGIWSLARAIL